MVQFLSHVHVELCFITHTSTCTHSLKYKMHTGMHTKSLRFTTALILQETERQKVHKKTHIPSHTLAETSHTLQGECYMSCLDMPALLLVCWNGLLVCGISPSKTRSLRPQRRPPSQAQQTQEQHLSHRLQWGVEPQVLPPRLPPLYFPQDTLAGFKTCESREKQTFIMLLCLSVKKIERNTDTLRK